MTWQEACYELIDRTIRGKSVSAVEFHDLKTSAVSDHEEKYRTPQFIDVLRALEQWKEEH